LYILYLGEFVYMGISFQRHFTTDKCLPFDAVNWKTFTASLKDYKTGKITFEQKDVEFPDFYSQNAINIIVSKYFRGILGTKNRETSYKQLISRVVDTNVSWAEKQQYFETEEDKNVFRDELTYILLHQYAYFNSPVWFNMGFEGREQTSSACFINSVEDNMHSILEFNKTEGLIFKAGSGSGVNISSLRSQYEPLSSGGYSSGALSFMKVSDANAGSIKSGGATRRAAKMVIMNVDHPEIVDFIQCKVKEEEKAYALIREGYDPSYNGEAYSTIAFQNANNSVRVTDNFMNLVKEKKQFWTKFITTGKNYKQYNAYEMMNLIAEATWKTGDPGLQFHDHINKMNTCKSDECIATNPCVTGETLIAVADGREYVSIRDLAKEKKDVPVYSYNMVTKQIEIKTARNPRKTQKNAKILKITFDDKSSIKLTENHRLLMKNGEYKEAKDIKIKERIMPFNKWQTKGINKGSRCKYWYVHLNSQERTCKAEHNLIYKYIYGEDLKDGYCIHHKDRNGTNNSFENLEYIKCSEHSKMHMLIKNPMKDGWWDNLSDEEKNKHKKKMSLLVSGEKNPMYGKKHSEETKRKISKALIGKKCWCEGLTKETNSHLMDLSIKQTKNHGTVNCKYCNKEIERKGHKRKNKNFCNMVCCGKYYGSNKDINTIRRKASILYHEKIRNKNREFQTLLYEEMLEKGINITRKGFKEEALNRGIPHDIRHTFGTFKKMIDSCSYANHKVVCIEEYGVEDVYNITVDDNHNLAYVLDVDKKTKDGFRKITGIISANCSEYSAWQNTSCNLASINLMKFLNKEDGSFLVDDFINTVWILSTAMDVWIDNADYPTQRISEETKKFRTIGVGYSNLGSLIMSQGWAYDSDMAREFASSITSLMTATAYSRAAEHCKSLQPFPKWVENKTSMIDVLKEHLSSTKSIDKNSYNSEIIKKSIKTWQTAINTGEDFGFRNSFVSVLAPTGTISLAMDCDTTGCEPTLGLITYKLLAGSDISLEMINETVNSALVKLGYCEEDIKLIREHIKENNFVEGCDLLSDKHLSVFDTSLKGKGSRYISHLGHLKMLAAIQPFISGALSKTINMHNECTVEEIADAYMTAWEMGIKCVAIYRDGSKGSQPLTTIKQKRSRATRVRLPDDVESIRHKFTINGMDIIIQCGVYPDGNLGEIFVTGCQQGSTMRGLLDCWAITMSMSLQYGVPLKELIKKFVNTQFEPHGFTGKSDIVFCSSIVDYIVRFLAIKFLDEKERKSIGINGSKSKETPIISKNETKKTEDSPINTSGTLCDICGSPMNDNGSCKLCPRCGNTTGCS
jgi:ribonucleotide reductase alpha subunit